MHDLTPFVLDIINSMNLPTPLRLVMGAGGALLILSLFMSWAEGASGWERLTIGDVFLLITGILALLTAISGGRIIAAAAGDYRVMRGAPLFPRLD